MALDGFGGFTQGLSEAARRGLGELRRLIGVSQAAADAAQVTADAKLAKAGDTATGRMYFNGDDVSAADDTGFVQLGPSGGANMGIDANEIQSRSGGVGSSLFINADGGEVRVNSGRLRVLDNGSVTDDGSRHFLRCGTGHTSRQVIQRGVETVAFSAATAVAGSVSFAEAFSASPTVVCQTEVPNNSGVYNQFHVVIYSVGAAGFSYKVVNIAGASTTATFEVHWTAMGAMA